MVAFPDAGVALRRAEWECVAVELRARAIALIESLIPDEDEVDTRRALLELALLNPVDHAFEIDTEPYYDADEQDQGEGEATDSTLRGLDGDLDAARG